MATATLGREHTVPQRRRLLRNLATVATLAGRLAYEDLGDAASGRSYYSLAADSAHADSGDHTAAAHALDRAKPTTAQLVMAPSLLIDHGIAHLRAATGHVHLQAGDHSAARAALTTALDQLPSTTRRARILALADLAMAELRAGNLADACRHAITAADLLHRTPYATGATRLRAFRATAARPLDPQTLRALDAHSPTSPPD